MRGVRETGGAARTAVQLGGESGGAVAHPRDGLGLGTRDEQHERGMREQVDDRGVPADASAVGDDVGGRVRGVTELREGTAEGGPEPGEPGGLLGDTEPDEHFEPAAQRLYVVPELIGNEAAPSGRGNGQHAGVGVEHPAVRGGTAVDEVTAGRVGLGEQRPPRPDRRERDGRGGHAG